MPKSDHDVNKNYLRNGLKYSLSLPFILLKVLMSTTLDVDMHFATAFRSLSLHFSYSGFEVLGGKLLKATGLIRVRSNMMSTREKYLQMPLEKKRELYKCAKYITIQDIKPFTNKEDSMGSKISIWEGDITALEIDAIVNAANSSLLGGGGVDGAIHRRAGADLKTECATLGGCPAGHAKITCGYKLPAKYVIHTVGPMGEKPDILASCYNSCFDLMAFPCIATGVYGYPNEGASHVALKACKKFLDIHHSKVDRIIFCVFLPVDLKLYNDNVSKYF